MDEYLKQMDDLIERSASTATGIDYANVEEISRARLSLPRRMYGGGLRRQQLVSLAAYAGCAVPPLPRMLDRTTRDGQVIEGFMPVLETSLGAGSFDHCRLRDKDHFKTYVDPADGALRLRHPFQPRRDEDAGGGGMGLPTAPPTSGTSRRTPLGLGSRTEPSWTSSSER